MISPVRGALLTALAFAVTASHAAGMPWEPSWASAKAKAQKTGRLVMIDFYAVWCGPCKQMKATTLVDPIVVSAAKSLIPFTVDAERDGRSLARKYGINSYPTFLFVDGSGEVFGRMSGGTNAANFSRIMQAAVDRHKDFKTFTARSKANTRDGEAFAALADVNAGRGRIAVAMDQAKKAESLGYKGLRLAKAWVALGESTRQMDRPAEAIVYYTRSLKAKGGPREVSYAHAAIAALSLMLDRRVDAQKHAQAAKKVKNAPQDVLELAERVLTQLAGG